jgi:hypothetical protein
MGAAIDENGSARKGRRQINRITVVVQGCGAAAKPGWYRGNTAAQPHSWLVVKPRMLGEVARFSAWGAPGQRMDRKDLAR